MFIHYDSVKTETSVKLNMERHFNILKV